LTRAEAGFRKANMVLFAAATRRRSGECMGGEDGRRSVTEADDWMRAQQIACPEKMSQMLVPGNFKKI
jgi:hypothetical protein